MSGKDAVCGSQSRQDLTKIKECIREDIIRCMNRERVVSDEEIKDMIQQRVLDLGHEMYFSVTQKQEMIQGIFNSLRKLDILQEILEQDDVTEIMVNGYQTIFIEKAGRLYRYPHSFSSQSKLEDVIQQIVSRMNRVVNEASPIVDVRLEDGSRVNVVLPPVAINGPILTIRKFPNQPIAIQTLIEIGSITREATEFLKSLVIAGYNIFISGGTGSGKTTFLNALSCFIPETERLITVEDSAELQIQGIANLVRLEAREANLEGKNAVSIRDLLRSALRMRPDRIILGEVRDAAACELLTAMNTGHDGSLSTGHANSPKDMMTRLETMVLMGMEMPVTAIRSQISSAIDIVVHLARLRDKSRKVVQIAEVGDYIGGEVALTPLYKFVETGQDKNGKVFGKLVRQENSLIRTEKLKAAGYM